MGPPTADTQKAIVANRGAPWEVRAGGTGPVLPTEEHPAHAQRWYKTWTWSWGHLSFPVPSVAGKSSRGGEWGAPRLQGRQTPGDLMGTPAPPRAFIPSDGPLRDPPGAAGAQAGGFLSALQCDDAPGPELLVSSFIHSLINPALLSAGSALLFYRHLPAFIKRPGTGKALPLKLRLVGLSESAAMVLM